MAYSVFLELTFTEGEAHFIGLYGLNLAQIAVDAIKEKLVEQYEIDASLRTEDNLTELRELKAALRALRVENEELKTSVRKPSAFSRIMKGVR